MYKAICCCTQSDAYCCNAILQKEGSLQCFSQKRTACSPGAFVSALAAWVLPKQKHYPWRLLHLASCPCTQPFMQMISSARHTLTTCKTSIPLLNTNSAILCDSAGCMPVFARTSSCTCECVRCLQAGPPCVARPVQEGWQDSKGAGGSWAPLMSPRNITKWTLPMWLSR